MTTTEAKLRLKGEENFMVIDIKQYWFDGDMLCLVYANGCRHFIMKSEVAEFEVPDK